MSESLHTALASAGFVAIVPSAGLAVDLKYATGDNAFGRNLYGDFNRAYLHPLAAGKLSAAVADLAAHRPGLRLVLLDALRPRSVQRLLWETVKGTDFQKFVADPETGSIHNYGFAVDVTLAGPDGAWLDMGTAYDDFTDLAQPRHEEAFLSQGRLAARQVGNRWLLRKVMEGAGFIHLPLEWWHFDALPKAEVKSGYAMVE